MLYGTRPPRDVSAWATHDPFGVTRLLIVNRSTDRPARLAVPSGSARLLQLTTRAASTSTGARWAGWHDAPSVYHPTHQRAVIGRHGHITITLPAASADVLALGASAG